MGCSDTGSRAGDTESLPEPAEGLVQEHQLYPESGGSSLFDGHPSYQKGWLPICHFRFYGVSDPLSGWLRGIYRVHGQGGSGALPGAWTEF